MIDSTAISYTLLNYCIVVVYEFACSNAVKVSELSQHNQTV